MKHQWNKEKSNKWNDFQPVLHPAAADFEERVVYRDGDSFAKSDSDIEAKNLIGLLQLDDHALADKRKRYIRRKREDMNAYDQDTAAFFSILLEAEPCGIAYPRAIKEEFGIDVWQMISS